MIPDQLYQEVKRRFGNIEHTQLDKTTFFYRPITLEEYKYITKLLPEDYLDTDLEDILVKIAVVYPTDINFDKIKAGHVTTLADQILRISGLSDLDFLVNTLEKYRQEVEEASYMMKAFVLATMPAYTEEDLDQLTIELLIRKVALAEKIVTVQQATLGLPSEAAFSFAFGGEEPQKESSPKPQNKAPIDKEKLLSKLAENEFETSGNARAKEAFRNFDETTLEAMAGTPKPIDPIAERLRQALL